jgi:Rrf2 family protein
LLAIGYIAKNCGDGVVRSEDIAQQYEIPLEYLLKILQQLVRAKVLRSKRGPRGGFWLAKPTNKITMLEIIKAVDGSIPSELNLAKQTRKDKYATKVQETYTKAISGAKNVLEKARLSNLLGGE